MISCQLANSVLTVEAKFSNLKTLIEVHPEMAVSFNRFKPY